MPAAYRITTAKGSPRPAWEIAELFPFQGQWSEEEYLDLKTPRLVEYVDGVIEVLPVPTMSHQIIVLFLYKLLDAYVSANSFGMALTAPLRVRLRPGCFRQPDIVFMLARHARRMREEYWEGADLVMEIVRADDPRRDRVTKRREYAKAGIAEYWIVDPRQRHITVLRLNKGQCVIHGRFTSGAMASSHLLRGFAVDVDKVFAPVEQSRAARTKQPIRGNRSKE